MYNKGDYVHYIPFEGCDPSLYQNGRVKSIQDDEHCFVVYHCAGNWDNYGAYTGQRTHVNQLKEGWSDNKTTEIEDNF